MKRSGRNDCADICRRVDRLISENISNVYFRLDDSDFSAACRNEIFRSIVLKNLHKTEELISIYKKETRLFTKKIVLKKLLNDSFSHSEGMLSELFSHKASLICKVLIPDAMIKHGENIPENFIYNIIFNKSVILRRKAREIFSD